jgi:hypothetical protein
VRAIRPTLFISSSDVNEETPNIVGPVDLEALALHVVRLSGALERAWSDALNVAVMEQAEGEMDTELSSFVTAMTGALEETDAKLLAGGIDPKIYSWPYDPEVFKSLEATFEPEARRSQLVVAQMIALREVLEAFKALQEASGEEVNLITKARVEWFEAGAFSLFRDRAMLLLRITREVDRVTDILLSEPADSKKLDLSIEAAVEALKAARSAYAHGDIDAALLHCRSALRGTLESMPFIERGDERLLTPGTLLAEVASLREYSSALCLLDAEAGALAGRRADFGVAVPLIDGLLPVIATIMHEPPIAELQTIITAETDSGD